MQWTTACPDWEQRIVQRMTLTPCPPLFPESAAEGWDRFARLKMVDLGKRGDDYPTFGDVTQPWAREFVEVIFGAYCGVEGHPDEGRSLITEFFMLISKKNSKSTLAAGIMLAAIQLNWRDEAEFIILAPTKEIADNSFKPMAAAIREDPVLAAVLKVNPHTRTITHKGNNATIKVVAADTAAAAGKKTVILLIDELHEFGKMHNADAIFTEAAGGLASRPEGFILYLTTQSSEPPAGVMLDKLTYARKVRSGDIVDPQFLPIIYEFPEFYLDPEVEPRRYLDPANFYITNPNMGYSVDERFLVRTIEQAEQTSAKKLQDVLAKHLNIQVGMNQSARAWAGAQVWLSAEKVETTLDLLINTCEVIVAGVDGGGLDDLYGLAFMGRERGTGRLLLHNHALAHPIAMERRKEIAPRLRDFEKDGDLTVVDEVGQDTAIVVAMMLKLHKSGLLFGIGFDPNSLGGLLADLVNAGIPEDKLIRVATGWRLAAAITTAERYLGARCIAHSHSAMMSWCVGNAMAIQQGNAVVINKAVSGKAKIDPLMATFNCVELMAGNPPSMRRSINFDQMVPLG